MSERLEELVRGCTFDDFLFAPHFGVLERRDPRTVDLRGRLSEHITLARPLVSANMDTVTRAEMAIALAEHGGLGVIDRGFRAGRSPTRSERSSVSSARSTVSFESRGRSVRTRRLRRRWRT
jgi:IMP dehydrogenase